MKKSKWIWVNTTPTKDSYGEFYDCFNYQKGKAFIEISADSNYALYINGEFVQCGQYPDFPHYKIYDEIDITKYCKKGKNSVALVVWYYGESNMSYFPGNASLRFEICVDDVLVCYSSKSTLSRLSVAYKNSNLKKITGQIGYSYFYDITKEDDWKIGNLCCFNDSVELDQDLPLYRRPIEKCVIGTRCNTTLLASNDGTHFLFDLGKEEVGFLTLKLNSSKNQTVVICYGEHIVDGGVRRRIGTHRDFSVEVVVGAGENQYTNPFRRLGLRYIEVFCEHPIDVEYISVLPVYYPVKKVQKQPKNAVYKRIYNTAVRTLELCMHDHYEDCPWREQALFVLDARNQMLFGYYAFENFKFARANLKLISKDNRQDNHLSICIPSGIDQVIPSFSLFYIIAVYEYVTHTNDIELLKEVYPKLCSVLKVFTDNMHANLVLNFTQPCQWNFYEWSPGLNGHDKYDGKQFDTALNCILVMALKCMSDLSKTLCIDNDYLGIADNIIIAMREKLFDSNLLLFVNNNHDDRVSELVNSFALICGAVPDEYKNHVAQKLVCSDELTPATLSMLGFKYDALISVDKDKYKPYILKDIETRFTRMLDNGATSFWETEKGESDFKGAGSLCHGWSSIPVYYFNILLNEDEWQ